MITRTSLIHFALYEYDIQNKIDVHENIYYMALGDFFSYLKRKSKEEYTRNDLRMEVSEYLRDSIPFRGNEQLKKGLSILINDFLDHAIKENS